MSVLIVGLFLFLGMHLLPSAVPVRDALVRRLGPGPYKGLFSLMSLIGLALLIYGKAKAPFIVVWLPPIWTRHLALSIMPFSLILLAASQLPGNVKRFTRHPMLWGVALWAFAHLAANGDLAAILLFGGFGLYALFAMWSANRRGAQLSEKRYAASKDIVVVAVGLAAYVALLLLHPVLFGVSPLA